MVRAILEGRKTQTRRVVKPELVSMWDEPRGGADVAAGYPWVELDGEKYKAVELCPYGRPGGLLWVRETWAMFEEHYIYEYGWEPEGIVELASYKDSPTNTTRQRYDVVYRADGYEADLSAGEKWCPSIFMPRWASRITLRVTDVRVERVQDISADDARDEGVCLDTWKLHQSHDGTISMSLAAVQEFRSLWDSINAKRGFGWDVNPWVWVVEFEVAK